MNVDTPKMLPLARSGAHRFPELVQSELLKKTPKALLWSSRLGERSPPKTESDGASCGKVKQGIFNGRCHGISTVPGVPLWVCQAMFLRHICLAETVSLAFLS